MKDLPALLGVVIVVVVAGCIGGSPSSTPTSSTTKLTTTADRTTTNQTTVVEENVFVYENLSQQSKAGFRKLLGNRTVSSSGPLFGAEIAEPHYNTFYITYNGTEYEIRHQRQQTETQVCLQSVKLVENSSIGDGDVVGAYANLSNSSRRLFNRVSTGNYTNTCYQPSDYPLTSYSIINYQGKYYQLIEQHGSRYTYKYRLLESS